MEQTQANQGYPLMRVQVYYNVRKKCFSIRHNGHVFDYAEAVYLEKCAFRVQKKGRERVLSSGRKNVHAYVSGDLVYYACKNEFLYTVIKEMGLKEEVFYNPFKVDSFTKIKDNTRVDSCQKVTLIDKQIFIS